MNNERAEALQALRTWAAPGARARLIFKAWQAGARNIRALADAANVSRSTVYADLAEQGIDPRTHRDRETPPMITPITSRGLTGNDPRDRDHIRGLLREWDTQHANLPEPDLTRQREATYKELSRTQGVVRWHNALVDHANQVAAAEEDARRALDVVEKRWADLRAAGAWVAAYHVWIESVDAARKAIQRWVDVATAAAQESVKHRAGQLMQIARTAPDHREARETLDECNAIYRAITTPENRITLPDPQDVEKFLLDLNATTIERKALAAETLRYAVAETAR